ncbi:AbrB/MazE/SpoVT family DNA-binding domain-containing protein [Pusillimonas sp. ANT_WB101]|nr:AbrB/MazE/SpoVT family DNA-binding domain-containing protein [Pusillimonas sp. ANT_WB101]
MCAACRRWRSSAGLVTAHCPTVPADIRAQVQAQPGTRLVWSVMTDGIITVRVKSKPMLDMAGILKAPKSKHVSVEDMNLWR